MRHYVNRVVVAAVAFFHGHELSASRKNIVGNHRVFARPRVSRAGFTKPVFRAQASFHILEVAYVAQSCHESHHPRHIEYEALVFFAVKHIKKSFAPVFGKGGILSRARIAYVRVLAVYVRAVGFIVYRSHNSAGRENVALVFFHIEGVILASFLRHFLGYRLRAVVAAGRIHAEFRAVVCFHAEHVASVVFDFPYRSEYRIISLHLMVSLRRKRGCLFLIRCGISHDFAGIGRALQLLCKYLCKGFCKSAASRYIYIPVSCVYAHHEPLRELQPVSRVLVPEHVREIVGIPAKKADYQCRAVLIGHSFVVKCPVFVFCNPFPELS